MRLLSLLTLLVGVGASSSVEAQRFSMAANAGSLAMGLAGGSMTLGGSGTFTLRAEAPSFGVRAHGEVTGLEHREPGFFAGLALVGGYAGEDLQVDGYGGADAMSVAVLGPLNKGRINGIVPAFGGRAAYYGPWFRHSFGATTALLCRVVTGSAIWEGVGCSAALGLVWRPGGKKE
jgi:hypothetical protein